MASHTGTQIRHYNSSFDPNDVEDSCWLLVRRASGRFKATSREYVHFKPFTEGITNTIIKVTRQEPGESAEDADRSAILIRAYGNGTDTMIDRAKELRVHSLLAERGLASAVRGSFNNGFMCGYVPGRTSEAKDYRDPFISRAIAKRLGEWHGGLPLSVLPPDNEEVPDIWSNSQKWISLLPNDTDELKARNQMFRAELKWLLELMGNTPGLDGKDLVVSHTDLLCGNVIIEEGKTANKDQTSVSIIDFEYVTAGPPAFDIANWFAEWMGPELEHSWMPSQSQRLDFIEHYVESFRKSSQPDKESSGESSAEEVVQQLYNQAQLFRGLPGFYWGIWGLIQASISDIDFDYISYAAKRLSEYWGWKAEYQGSRAREGLEATVREQAWSKP